MDTMVVVVTIRCRAFAREKMAVLTRILSGRVSGIYCDGITAGIEESDLR